MPTASRSTAGKAKSRGHDQPAEIKLRATGSTLQDQQLMAEGEDLGLERSPTSNAFPNRRKQRENDRGHNTLNLPRQSSKFNWLNKNGFFGMDTTLRASCSFS